MATERELNDVAILNPVKSQKAVCARCHKAMGDEQFKVGRYTYGDCCILKVEEPSAKS